MTFLSSFQTRENYSATIFQTSHGFEAQVEILPDVVITVDVVTEKMNAIAQRVLKNVCKGYLMDASDGRTVLYLGEYGLAGGAPSEFSELRAMAFIESDFLRDELLYGEEIAAKARMYESKALLEVVKTTAICLLPIALEYQLLIAFGQAAYSDCQSICQEEYIQKLERNNISVQSLVNEITPSTFKLPADNINQWKVNPLFNQASSILGEAGEKYAEEILENLKKNIKEMQDIEKTKSPTLASKILEQHEKINVGIASAELLSAIIARKYPKAAATLNIGANLGKSVMTGLTMVAAGASTLSIATFGLQAATHLFSNAINLFKSNPEACGFAQIKGMLRNIAEYQETQFEKISKHLEQIDANQLVYYQNIMKEFSQLHESVQELDKSIAQLEASIADFKMFQEELFQKLNRNIIFDNPIQLAFSKLEDNTATKQDFTHALAILKVWGTVQAQQDDFIGVYKFRRESIERLKWPAPYCIGIVSEFFKIKEKPLNTDMWIESCSKFVKYATLKLEKKIDDFDMGPSIEPVIKHLMKAGEAHLEFIFKLQSIAPHFWTTMSDLKEGLREIASMHVSDTLVAPFLDSESVTQLQLLDRLVHKYIDLAFGDSSVILSAFPAAFSPLDDFVNKARLLLQSKSLNRNNQLVLLIQNQQDRYALLEALIHALSKHYRDNPHLVKMGQVGEILSQLRAFARLFLPNDSEQQGDWRDQDIPPLQLSDELKLESLPKDRQGARIAITLGWGREDKSWKSDFLLDVLQNLAINEKGVGGLTLLHIACIHGNLAAANALLKLNASVNVQDLLGNYPLHFAAQSGNRELILLIMNKRQISDLITLTNLEGFTPKQLLPAEFPDLCQLADLLTRCDMKKNQLTEIDKDIEQNDKALRGLIDQWSKLNGKRTSGTKTEREKIILQMKAIDDQRSPIAIRLNGPDGLRIRRSEIEKELEAAKVSLKKIESDLLNLS